MILKQQIEFYSFQQQKYKYQFNQSNRLFETIKQKFQYNSNLRHGENINNFQNEGYILDYRKNKRDGGVAPIRNIEIKCKMNQSIIVENAIETITVEVLNENSKNNIEM